MNIGGLVNSSSSQIGKKLNGQMNYWSNKANGKHLGSSRAFRVNHLTIQQTKESTT